MAREKNSKQTANCNGGRPQGHLDFEATLWVTTGKLRGNLDAATYRHAVLGLIFLKYKDIIGRVYEYFLSEFASVESKKGGQFYTARRIVQLLIEWLAPCRGCLFGAFWRRLGQLVFLFCVLMLLGGMSGCAGRCPVTSGVVLGFTRADPVLTTNDLAYAKTLQVHWLGTACYLVRLGDKVIFTDPFLTHQSLVRVALGGSIKSDPHTVSNALAGLSVPQAIFVGHSHYDHLLDAAECLKQPGWSGVPVFGSESTRNILCAYGEPFTNTWRQVVTNASWQEVAAGIRYKAIPATHGRQLPVLPLLYAGSVNKPMRKPPRQASDFKVGDDYAFLFELSNDQATNTIYFVGAAHRDQQGFPDDSVKSVDVAILCVPTWKLSKGYPGNIIQRLKPRHIIASHYDNFFQVNRKPTEVVALADMDGFLIRAQKSAAYHRFESIQVPSVGSVLRLERKAAGR